MIYKIIFRILLINFILIKKIISNPSCEIYINHCYKCNPKTNLCSKCEIPEILMPDENGGCIGSKKCILGKNYCLECDANGELCKMCDSGFYPDENGACSYSNYCKISYKGECIECLDNYILIGQRFNLKICKSLLSEDFLNCKEIDKEKGLCKECEEGYYLNNGDKKCTKTEKCNESVFGNCISCNRGYYYDKTENLCKEQEDNNFLHCKQTIDGINCEECEDDIYSDENGNCTFTNHCSQSSNSKCEKCINGYYLTDNSFCSDSENCHYADGETGVCAQCKENYYLDDKDYKCKLNINNKEFQFCQKIENDICVKCELYYSLDEESKCCNTFNCAKSENGICILCSENYYLGLDNYCSNVEHCIYSKLTQCIECEDNYYYSISEEKCLEAEDKFYGCKISNEDGYFCSECKNNYYLRRNDSLCFENSDEDYYKCAFTDYKGENCTKCIEGYYLGSEDKKCGLIKGCSIYENENKCVKCDNGYCFDVKNNNCVNNEKIDNENIKIYFACNRTNKEGLSCEECIEGYEVNEEGYCIDVEKCEEKKDGKCMKCSEDNDGNEYCANDTFGCVKSLVKFCLICNNILDLTQCSECKEGYSKTPYGNCVKGN